MDSMTGLGSLTQGDVTTTAQSLGSLDSDAFMNLMVAQLRYQDPLAPSDASSMMQQTSMLAQTELMTKLASAQQQMLGLQRATVAADLVGTQVEGVTADGVEVSGVVEMVRFSATGPVLVIGGAELALEDATGFGAAASDPVDEPTTDPAEEPASTA